MKKILLLLTTFLLMIPLNAQKTNTGWLNSVRHIYKNYDSALQSINMPEEDVEASKIKAKEQRTASLKEIHQRIIANEVFIGSEKNGKPDRSAEDEQTSAIPETSMVQLRALQQKFAQIFPADALAETGNHSAMLTFTLDTDGKIKKVQAQGADEAFNLVSIITLYSLNSTIDPILFNGQKVATNFTIPVKFKAQ